MNQLNAFLALETIHDNIERAERHRRAHPAPEHPPPDDTLHAGDRRRLRGVALFPKDLPRPLQEPP